MTLIFTLRSFSTSIVSGRDHIACFTEGCFPKDPFVNIAVLVHTWTAVGQQVSWALTAHCVISPLVFVVFTTQM